MEVIEGGKGKQAQFVCGWCGASFAERYGPDSLELHWKQNQACWNNRSVSNPLQSKYGMAKGIESVPGEPTLNRIRVTAGCLHPINLREPIYDTLEASGPQQGYRCGYCYTEVYNGTE